LEKEIWEKRNWSVKVNVVIRGKHLREWAREFSKDKQTLCHHVKKYKASAHKDKPHSSFKPSYVTQLGDFLMKKCYIQYKRKVHQNLMWANIKTSFWYNSLVHSKEWKKLFQIVGRSSK
jgi:hypothetical protein